MFYIPQLTLVRVWLAQDTPSSKAQARDLLDQLEDIAKGAHLTSALLFILLAQSLLAHQQGDEPAARNHLADAIHLSEPNGIIRPFVDIGPEIAPLLMHLRLQGTGQDTLTQIIEAFPTQHAVDPHKQQGALLEPLTEREFEVLTLLARQKRNRDIADGLVITVGTVKQYTHIIYRKLNVTNRHEAVRKAKALGILSTRM